jgi:hypothetical protein
VFLFPVDFLPPDDFRAAALVLVFAPAGDFPRFEEASFEAGEAFIPPTDLRAAIWDVECESDIY